MADLTLAAIGTLPAGLLEDLAEFLTGATGCRCAAGDAVLDPAVAYDPRRDQYDCRRIFPQLEELAGASGTTVFGVADVDLYSAVFTFVFGETQLRGRAGMMSVHRLRPALYGLPDDPELVKARAEREALHEVGHLFGLVHCRSSDCVMRFSGSVEEVDLKQSRFCEVCRTELEAGRPLGTHPPR